MSRPFADVDPVVSRRMACVRGKNTRPEMLVRRMLHAMGYRFRVHATDVHGRPDIVNRTRRKAVFVNGCYWHKHGCANDRPATSRREFWEAKRDDTRARDGRNLLALQSEGWDVLVVWECETGDLDALASRLREFWERNAK